jgi:hypothetical protein
MPASAGMTPRSYFDQTHDRTFSLPLPSYKLPNSQYRADPRICAIRMPMTVENFLSIVVPVTRKTILLSAGQLVLLGLPLR